MEVAGPGRRRTAGRSKARGALGRSSGSIRRRPCRSKARSFTETHTKIDEGRRETLGWTDGTPRHRSLTASRTPRSTKSVPAACDRRVYARGWPAKKRRTEAAAIARNRHQAVPVAMNVKPSAMNAATFVGLAWSMNCGRKARKNNATLGLRTLVTTPCRNAFHDCLGASCADTDAV